MSTGAVKSFVDFSGNSGGDTGETDSDSIQPFTDGEKARALVLNRSPENLRQRSENLRDFGDDTLYLRDADRGGLTLGGPAVVTWPGSTTAVASGIPTLSDNLYLIPFLTPGYPQVAPVPPVASVYGTLTLNRTGPAAGITVTSNRRSYFGGDKINVTVALGGAASAVLSDAGAGDRSILLTVTAGTTLTAAIALLNAVTAAPSATQLVVASLAAGATGTDTLVTTQAKQYVAGNIDAEAHTLTPAAFTTFFGTVGNRLAEGDTLCIQYASLAEASPGTGGRRQSIPENTNTTIPAGSFFNSRVNPEKLVNAIPIAKVINNTLVFIGGFAIAAGASAAIATGSIATTTALGTVKLLHASLTPAAPVVVSDGSRDVASGVVGLDASKRAAVTSTTGDAFTGTSGAGNGRGANFTGQGSGAGVEGTGGATGRGVKGTGGVTDGIGVEGISGGASGTGLRGRATGTGTAVVGIADDGGMAAALVGGKGTVCQNTDAGTEAALTVQAAAATILPAFAAKTMTNYPRTLVDHNGYRMGQVTEYYEPWTGSLGALATSGALTTCPDNHDWVYWFDAGGFMAQGVLGSETDLYNVVIAASSATIGDKVVLYSQRNPIKLQSYTSKPIVVVEFTVNGGNFGSGVANILSVGLGSGVLAAVGVDLVNDTDSIYLYRQGGYTNWLFNINSGGVGGTIVDTGIVPTAGANATDVLRLEISEGTVKAYVNGVLGATRSNAHTINHFYKLVMAVRSTGASAVGQFGPVRACWANKEIPPNM